LAGCCAGEGFDAGAFASAAVAAIDPDANLSRWRCPNESTSCSAIAASASQLPHRLFVRTQRIWPNAPSPAVVTFYSRADRKQMPPIRKPYWPGLISGERCPNATVGSRLPSHMLLRDGTALSYLLKSGAVLDGLGSPEQAVWQLAGVSSANVATRYFVWTRSSRKMSPCIGYRNGRERQNCLSGPAFLRQRRRLLRDLCRNPSRVGFVPAERAASADTVRLPNGRASQLRRLRFYRAAANSLSIARPSARLTPGRC